MTFQGYPYLQKSSKKRYQELPTSGRPSQSHTSSCVLWRVAVECVAGRSAALSIGAAAAEHLTN